MFRTSGNPRWRRIRSSWRAAVVTVRRLPALYVAAFAWAAATVTGELIAVRMIARVMLVIGVVIALYAMTAAFVVFLACGRFGIVRTPRWRTRAATIAVGSSFGWILGSAWHEGRSTLNLVAIAAAELAGVALYLGRRSAFTAARRRLHVEA
jgi:hypothetical protein